MGKFILISFLFAVIGTPKVLGYPRLNFYNTDGEPPQRIVFGNDVAPGDFIAYQVSLQYFTKQGVHKHFCSGSIISSEHILTAAHCAPPSMNLDRMSVVAGIRNLQDRNGTRSQVTAIHGHSGYEELMYNDIAILKIQPPLEFSERIKPISVNNTEFVGENVPVTLTGWGLRLPVELPFLMEEANFPSTLQIMKYSTISNDLCKELGMTDVTQGELCAYRNQFLPQGACMGDSGGPLVTSTKDGLSQVGIVSYGFGVCGFWPDVYTRVSHYTEWIEGKMRET